MVKKRFKNTILTDDLDVILDLGFGRSPLDSITVRIGCNSILSVFTRKEPDDKLRDELRSSLPAIGKHAYIFRWLAEKYVLIDPRRL